MWTTAKVPIEGLAVLARDFGATVGRSRDWVIIVDGVDAGLLTCGSTAGGEIKNDGSTGFGPVIHTATVDSALCNARGLGIAETAKR